MEHAARSCIALALSKLAMSDDDVFFEALLLDPRVLLMLEAVDGALTLAFTAALELPLFK